MYEETPRMILAVSKQDGDKMISALQLKKGLRMGDLTYLATLKVETKSLARILCQRWCAGF